MNKILERESVCPGSSLRGDDKEEEEKEKKVRGERGPQSTKAHGVP